MQTKSCGVAILLLSVSALGATAPFEIQQPDFTNFTFEGAVPETFHAGEGSSTGIDTNLFKEGHASLRWDWTRPGAVLGFHCPEAFKHLTGQDPDPIVYEWATFTTLSTLNFWIFNDTPGDDELWMEIGRGIGTDCRFPMKLDFSGWREFRAMYGRDLPAFPSEGADTLRFIAPTGRPAGRLCFDLFQPRREMDVRQVRATPQAPWIFAGAQPPHAPRPSAVPARLDVTVPDRLSEAQLAVLARLTASVLDPYGTGVPAAPTPVSPVELDALRALHASRHFTRDGDQLSGSVGPIGGNGAYVATAGDKAFWGEAMQFATAWARAGAQPEVRRDLEAWFMDYVDLCIQHGSGGGYATRDSFARTVLWMKEPLIRHGRFEPLMTRLRAMIGTEGLYQPEPVGDADVYNTTIPANLCLIFMQDDPRAKYRDLKALQHWLDRTALHGEIRPDGSFFHHSQTYSGYNVPAIEPLVRCSRLLAGTEFYSPASHAMARRAACALNFYSCNGDVPHTLGGRWRGAGSFLPVGLQVFWQLAECGTVPESAIRNPQSAIDTEMAAIHLYYCRLDGKDDEHAVKYRAQGIEPWKPDGHLTLNYTVAAVHRRDDWMVFFRGQRYPFLATEAYAVQAGNTMGRYLNYGHLSVVSGGHPPTEAGSGIGFPGNEIDCGWNFNFWPGTTAREIPHEALRSHFQVEEFLTSETFAAGTSLDGNGIFGMKLQEELPGAVDAKRVGPPVYWLGEDEYGRRIRDSLYDPTFRARKSVFCFDNRIVCLGSDIRAEDGAHRVCTTLFQQCVTGEQGSASSPSFFEGPDSVRVAADTEVGPPLTVLSTASNATWIIDHNGTGYFLPAGNDPVEYSRAMRKLPYHSHWNPADTNLHERIVPNEGVTELAILDHGAAPDGKGYEYGVVMRATPEQMEGFRISDSNASPYVVVQRDRQAHIVRDRDSRTTGYVLFEDGPVSPNSEFRNLQSAVLHASKPCLVMVRETASGLRLSVCDPGIAGDALAGVAGPSVIQLGLRGWWGVAGSGAGVTGHRLDGGETLLNVTCRGAIPVVFELTKEGEGS